MRFGGNTTMRRSRSYRTLYALALFSMTLAVGCEADEPTVIIRDNEAQGGGTGESGNGGSGGDDDDEPTCVEEPSAPEEFLVRCTDSACRPFDNVARLPLYRAGEALPEVP
jgi:hypothetical protein